jgi:integrase
MAPTADCGRLTGQPFRSRNRHGRGLRKPCGHTADQYEYGSESWCGWIFPADVFDFAACHGEDVNVVQELLRHSSARITMDVYAQAVTPAKCNAQGKVVAMLRESKKEEQG